MKGIQFLVDENNEKVAVQIDLKIFGERWEDIYDALLLENKSEPSDDNTSFDDFIEELKEDKILNEEDIKYIYSKGNSSN
jgi:hypothetical protein